ncbi:hypothetical protein ZWY2020_022935 [Hordeum vulgare]|nr:hypothetical protein ZWY2020_022935 [Hordeum vulgare]
MSWCPSSWLPELRRTPPAPGTRSLARACLQRVFHELPEPPSSDSAVPRARPKLDPAAAAQHLRPTSPLAVPAAFFGAATPVGDEELTRGLPCTSPPRIDLAPRSSSLGQEHLVVLDLAAVGDQH